MHQWLGSSGASYDFAIFPLGTTFNAVSAVYMLICPVMDQWLVLYVGETDSLLDRINRGYADHDGMQRALAMGATHVAVYPIEERKGRLFIETDLRRGLQPSCNAQGLRTYLSRGY